MNTHVAAVYTPGHGLNLEEVAVRAPRAGEVRIQVKAAGVCHSDLHILTGDWPTDKSLVMGHEAAGVVSAIGTGVTGVQPGDHVVLSSFAPCRRCERCASGKPWLCTETKAVENTLPDGSTAFTAAAGDGKSGDGQASEGQSSESQEIWPYLGLGAFTSQITVPESAVVRVPQELPFEIGALLGCSITTGVGAAVNTAKVRPGESAIVIGCGGVGLSIIMGLRLAGADPIIAVDLSSERLEAARKFGATHTLVGNEVDVAAWAQTELGGVDYAFEAIGSPRIIETLPAMLHSGGAAVLVGMAPVDANVSFNPFELADQGKEIIGCNYGSSVGEVYIPD